MNGTYLPPLLLYQRTATVLQRLQYLTYIFLYLPL